MVSKSRSIEQNILVSYVGEGSIKIDDDVVNLPQSYSKVSVLEINIPDGAIIEIDYFTDLTLALIVTQTYLMPHFL